MILVLLGTNPYPFDRLLKAVDEWAGVSGERVIAQVGHTNMATRHVECHDFVPHERIMQWISKADVVIAQGGFGSLRDSLAAGRPTVAVPRLPELGECQDAQKELVDALAEEGRVVPLPDVSDLAAAIEQARQMKTMPGGGSRIPDIVAEAVAAALR